MISEIEIAHDIIKTALNKGADFVEVFISKDKELKIKIANKKVESVRIAEPIGFAVRTLKDKRMGFSYSSDFSKDAIDKTIDSAIAISRYKSPDDYNIIPSLDENCNPNSEINDLEIFDEQLEKISIDRKINDAIRIEESAFNYDSRVDKALFIQYVDIIRQNYIINSNGIERSYKKTFCGGFAWISAKDDKDTQTGTGESCSCFYSRFNPKIAGEIAASDAVQNLGAKRIKTQKGSVIFSPYMFCVLLHYFSQMFSAEAVHKKRSILCDRINTKVASDKVTIIDDGTLKDKSGSIPFDDEGITSSRTLLINKGNLVGFMHDSRSAYRDKVKPTGNTIRGSYKNPPSISPTNLFLSAGESSSDEIIKTTDKGLYITELLNFHTINPVSGDYSLGAVGRFIENGQFTHPVNGVTIAGNIIDLLTSIDAVGNDLRFFTLNVGSTGSPTVRVKDLMISGEN